MKKTHYKKAYLGFDVSGKTIEIFGRTAESDEGVSIQITNSKAAIKKFIEALPCPEKTVIAMETGTDSPWMSDYLSSFGCEVIVAHARDLALIWGSTAKCDRRDAEMLARLACFDQKLLHPVKHQDIEKRDDLCVIKARDTLVRVKITLISTVRNLMRSHGTDVSTLTPENFSQLAPKLLPDELRPALEGLLIQICYIRQEIKKYDRIIAKLCNKYPETKKIRQRKGVGPITALAFLLVIGDPQRFSSAERLAAYLGLVPKRDQSGEVDRQLGITKQGNTFVRRYLIQGANYILGHFGEDCDLKRYGERIAARGGKIAKKKATVAVARKLSGLIYMLWKNDVVYDPNYKQNQRQAKTA